MKSFLRFAWNLVFVLSLIGWFPIGCLVISNTYAHMLGEEKKHAVDGTISEYFPVLVVIPATDDVMYTAEIVYYTDLVDYQVEHPGYQFLIPDGHKASIAAQISENTRGATGNYDDSALPFYAAVNMVPMKDGEQSFEVSYRDKDDWVNLGWYEASEKDFEPLFYERYFGPTKTLESYRVGFFIMFVLYTGIGVRRHLTRRRRKRAEITEPDGGTEET